MTASLAPAATAWHALPADEDLQLLSSTTGGLPSAEAATRLARHGPNAFTPPARHSAARVLADQLRSVFVVLLLAGAGVSLATGDLLDAVAIALVIVLNVVIGFVTELRARRALHALLGLDVQQARALRDGALRDLPAALLVPGDIIELEAGQRVPADARLIEDAELRTDEAALTGESEPVIKSAAAALAADTVLAERATMVYKATGISTGRGRAVVVATGMATEVGRIGSLTASVRDTRTPLEERLERLGRQLALVAVAVAAAVPVVWLLRGLPLAAVTQTAIALAVAAVPEGLPVVATVAMAIGLRRLARRRALVRRLAAVESLGSATVICTDKTGTLTAGAMTLTTLWLPDRVISVDGVGYAPDGGFSQDGVRMAHPGQDALLVAALRAGLLASRGDGVLRDGVWQALGDPTDAALAVAARKAGLDRSRLLADTPLAGELPFSAARMLAAGFLPEGAGLTAYVKGAPDRVLERCRRMAGPHGKAEPLDAAGRARVLARNAEMAAAGLRVLALARGRVAGVDDAAVRDLEFLGLAGMSDPPTPGARETIAAFRDAGLRVIMLTGDQQLTAVSVGRALGLLGAADRALEGREIDLLDDDALARRVADVSVVSRISPEAKLRVVQALQQRGECVAMLGDGINDAAALRQADIGVAMGRRGADLAKEAADVILLDDQFATIGSAIEQGRVIFDNIRHFVYYLFSCNLAEVMVFLGAALVRFGPPLLPLQILWLNLVTDTFPALALAVEPAEPGVMRRPPRPPNAALLPGRLTILTLADAGLIAALTLAAYAYGVHGGESGRAVTLAFNTLAVAQLLHLGNARSRDPVLGWHRVLANPWALAAVAGVLLLQGIATHWPPLAGALGLVPLTAGEWLVVLGLASVTGFAGQLRRLGRSRRWSRAAAL